MVQRCNLSPLCFRRSHKLTVTAEAVTQVCKNGDATESRSIHLYLLMYCSIIEFFLFLNSTGFDPWVVQPLERARYQEQFKSLNPANGIITGEQAKGLFLRSELPPAVLGQIWLVRSIRFLLVFLLIRLRWPIRALSDTDSDGKMDINEFSIACKLINLRLKGFEIPASLPLSMVQSIKMLAAGIY